MAAELPRTGESVLWSVVIKTANEDTALRLCDRVFERAGTPPLNPVLRPWNRGSPALLLQFSSELPSSAGNVEDVLGTAQRLAAVWTVDFSPDDAHGVVGTGWTPLDFHRPFVSGLGPVSFTLYRCAPFVEGTLWARVRTTPRGVAVGIIRRQDAARVPPVV